MQELRAHAKDLETQTGYAPQIVEEDGTNQVYVVLQKVALPTGLFAVNETDVLFITDRQYPLSAMDMFWTETTVVRRDGSIPQNGDVVENYLGRPWRRFSWHRNGVWNPARNGLLDHFSFMEARWEKELRP